VTDNKATIRAFTSWMLWAPGAPNCKGRGAQKTLYWVRPSSLYLSLVHSGCKGNPGGVGALLTWCVVSARIPEGKGFFF
jgi:hypothetical protein